MRTTNDGARVVDTKKPDIQHLALKSYPLDFPEILEIIQPLQGTKENYSGTTNDGRRVGSAFVSRICRSSPTSLTKAGETTPF